MSVCDVRGEDLSAFVDSELGILEHREIEAHLATCDACRATVRAWKRLGALFEPFIDEPIEFTPPVRVPQYLRTVLVASVLLLFVIGAVLLGSLGGGEPSGLASPGVPIASSVEPSPSRTREPRPAESPTPTRTEPAQTEPAIEQIDGSGERGPFAAAFTIDGPVSAGGPMEIAATLRNATGDPVSFDAPVESVFEVVIRDATGDEVLRRSVAAAWSGDTMTRTLRGSEVLRETFEVAGPEAAGEYTITIELPLEPSSFYTLPSPSPTQEPVEAFATEPVTFEVG